MAQNSKISQLPGFFDILFDVIPFLTRRQIEHSLHVASNCLKLIVENDIFRDKPLLLIPFVCFETDWQEWERGGHSFYLHINGLSLEKSSRTLSERKLAKIVPVPEYLRFGKVHLQIDILLERNFLMNFLMGFSIVRNVLLHRPVQLNKKRAKIINGFASAFEGSKLLLWLPCREDLEFHLVHSKARFCELMASPFWAETFAKCGSVQMEDVERLAMDGRDECHLLANPSSMLFRVNSLEFECGTTYVIQRLPILNDDEIVEWLNFPATTKRRLKLTAMGLEPDAMDWVKSIGCKLIDRFLNPPVDCTHPHQIEYELCLDVMFFNQIRPLTSNQPYFLAMNKTEALYFEYVKIPISIVSGGGDRCAGIFQRTKLSTAMGDKKSKPIIYKIDNLFFYQ